MRVFVATQKEIEFCIIALDASTTMRDLKHRLNEQHAVGAPELLRLMYKGHVLGDDQTMPGLVGCRKVGCHCTKEGEFTVVKLSDPGPVDGQILDPDTRRARLRRCRAGSAPAPAGNAAAALGSTDIGRAKAALSDMFHNEVRVNLPEKIVKITAC